MTGPEPRLVVHAASAGGHRSSYLDILTSALGGEAVCGPLSGSLRKALRQADKLLLATLDDDVAGFAALALERSARGRRTAALFLRPQSCFGAGARARVKRSVFQAVKRLPGLSIITIVPFAIAPDFQAVAHAGVWDPQYWDLIQDGRLPSFKRTQLTEDILALAGARGVVSLIGSVTFSKGVGFLADMLDATPELLENWLFVCAGRVHPAVRHIAERLKSAGAFIVDRHLSDAEIESLYGCSRAVWACYHPSYDQASGIFGRAIQLGVPAIIRAGSQLAVFADHYGIETLQLVFGDGGSVRNLDSSLATMTSNMPRQLSNRLAMIDGWRHHSLNVMRAAVQFSTQ
jgi:hypothetical protein